MIPVLVEAHHGYIWRVAPSNDLTLSQLGSFNGLQGWELDSQDLVPDSTPSLGHWSENEDGNLVPA